MIRFERQSVIMAVSSGLGRPEVEAELPPRSAAQRQLPGQRHLQGVPWEVSEVRRGPQLFVSRSNAGLVVYLLRTSGDPGRISPHRRRCAGSQPTLAFRGTPDKVAVDSIEREVDPVGACIEPAAHESSRS